MVSVIKWHYDQELQQKQLLQLLTLSTLKLDPNLKFVIWMCKRKKVAQMLILIIIVDIYWGPIFSSRLRQAGVD